MQAFIDAAQIFLKTLTITVSIVKPEVIEILCLIKFVIIAELSNHPLTLFHAK
jgi:hypothetical protein